MIKPVSADSLRKTGIFADKAGDFRRFPPQVRRTGSPETKSNARNAGISGPFSRFLGSLAERRNGWLTTKGSNSHIPNCKGAFEMSWEFRVSGLVSSLGDFLAFSRTKWETRRPVRWLVFPDQWKLHRAVRPQPRTRPDPDREVSFGPQILAYPPIYLTPAFRRPSRYVSI